MIILGRFQNLRQVWEKAAIESSIAMKRYKSRKDVEKNKEQGINRKKESDNIKSDNSDHSQSEPNIDNKINDEDKAEQSIFLFIKILLNFENLMIVEILR